MSESKISNELKELINNPDSVKVLASISKEGIPHVVFKDSIRVAEDGSIEFLEFIESSQTNKNLVYSLWFNKTVSIIVLLGKESFQLKGKVKRAIVSGKDFEEKYILTKSKGIDLSTVFRIEVEEIFDQNLAKRIGEEQEKHPLLRHLDFVAG